MADALTLLRRARRMRREPTEAEALLWHRLRGHRLNGYRFRRQQPVGHYIVDFVCLEYRLVVEVDGSQHIDGAAHDAVRTRWLQAQGFRVLRFWNDEVLRETDNVLDEVLRVLGELRGMK